MSDTKIEWATKVWNPVTGCSKVSAGCKNCYAETNAKRFWGKRKFTDVQCHEDRLMDPLHWKKPQRIFVNSMSDLFHPDVPFEFIYRVYHFMMGIPRHTYMILTKRPERAIEFFEWWTKPNRPMGVQPIWEYKNIWLGVSVEDQKTADERIPLLLQTPAALVFVFNSEYAKIEEEEAAKFIMQFNLDLTVINKTTILPKLDLSEALKKYREEKKDDIRKELNHLYEVIIECESEYEQENIFNQINNMGLKCRVLTL